MKKTKWIMQYYKKYIPHYILIMILCTLATLAMLVPAYVMGQITKVILESNYDRIYPLFGLLLFAVVGRGIVRYTYRYMTETITQKVFVKMKFDFYTFLQKQSFSFYDKNKIGELMSRISHDLNIIRQASAFTIVMLYVNVLLFLLALIFIMSINTTIGLTLFLVAPILGFVTLKFSRTMIPYFVKIRDQNSKLNTVCQENISGNRVVKAFAREDYEIAKFDKVNDKYRDLNIKSATKRSEFLPVMDFIASFQNVLLLLVGGYLVIFKDLELWQLTTINGYLWAINQPMRSIGWLTNELTMLTASVDKVYSVMHQKIKVKNKEDAIVKDDIQGDIKFDNVSFRYSYDNKDYDLRDISFEAKSGQTIGIVGSTGAGKSTLTYLISRFYDIEKGSVTVDGIDVRDYNLQSLRSHISFAMQDVFLFSDTIEGNLAYGVPHMPLEELKKYAKYADADNFINNLTDGYDTIVGERGVGLSGGQKQRISLARALATTPSVLILDDTTSAVDMETEHYIQGELDEHFKGVTKFIIAHRISSVKNADLILVLDDGKIIEQGTHDDLVKQEGYYHKMFTNQYSDYELYKKEGVI